MEFTNPRVLITDAKIESIKEIIPVLEQVTRLNQPLLIIAEDVTGERLCWHCTACRRHGVVGRVLPLCTPERELTSPQAAAGPLDKLQTCLHSADQAKLCP